MVEQHFTCCTLNSNVTFNLLFIFCILSFYWFSDFNCFTILLATGWLFFTYIVLYLFSAIMFTSWFSLQRMTYISKEFFSSLHRNISVKRHKVFSSRIVPIEICLSEFYVQNLYNFWIEWIFFTIPETMCLCSFGSFTMKSFHFCTWLAACKSDNCFTALNQRNINNFDCNASC